MTEKFGLIISIYKKPEVLRMLFLGFSSGLPLLLVLGTLSFWLRESGIDLKTIGFMSWIGLCWGCKWIWAPVVDSVRIPVLSDELGRRRAWLLVAQGGIAVALVGLAFSDPAQDLRSMALFALLVAFFGATQDVALDAYRIESADSHLQGALAAAYQMGYRIAMIWSGAGALAIAAMSEIEGTGGWKTAYLIMACSVLVGVVAVLFSPEDRTVASDRHVRRSPAQWFYESACLPFVDFFARYGWKMFVILLLIATYRISDIVMGIMANPFYQDMGFSKQEVAAVSKVFGVVMTLLGAFIGGVVTFRLGVMRTLFLGAALVAGTNLLFTALALIGHSMPFLIFAVSADNLAGGLASAAFVAYLSGLVSKNYSATQYALLSSVMLVLPKFMAGFSGMLVESVGYATFFTIAAAIGLPVLILVYLADRLGLRGE